MIYYHESSNCFQYHQKKTYLNQATKKKKYLLKYSYLRNPKIENVKPKKSFNHPCHLESRVPPWGYDHGQGLSYMTFIILHLRSCRPNTLQLKENVGFSLQGHNTFYCCLLGEKIKPIAVLNWDVSFKRFNLRYVTETKYSFVFVVMTLQIFG